MDSPDFMMTFVPAAVGMALGIASWGLKELISSCRARHDKRIQINRLRELLYQEIEQACELLAIDLAIPTQTPLAEALGESNSDTETFWRSRLTVLSQLREFRQIFDANASALLDLPGYTPNSLVRFHAAMTSKAVGMEDAGRRRDRHTWERLREELLARGEVMKTELSLPHR